MPHRVSLVGVGRVGATVGLMLATRYLADELVLVGRDRARVEAEAADLRHATVLGAPIRITAGDVAATAGSRVVVLTLGVSHRSTDRGAVAAANARLMRETVPALAEASPEAVFVVVTNPVDAMTGVVLRLSGLPERRVIGLGTLLDTMRLRDALSRRFGMQGRDTHAYVVGEHGDSQLVAWSSADAGGGPLALSAAEEREIEDAVRDAGPWVFLGKGHTNAGTATAVALLVEAVLRDSREVLPVSSRLVVDGVGETFLSLPTVIGADGVVRRIPLPLSADESAAFSRGGAAVRRTLESIEGDEDLPAA